jgi:hypothetical protein
MKTCLLTGIIFSILLFGCTAQDAPEEPIGGQRDEHGCLGPAGYSYDADVGACTRNWEIKEENQKQAAKIAVDFIRSEYGEKVKLGLTVVEVILAKCPGCFVVKLSTINHEMTTVNINNWEVAEDEINSFEDCVNAGNPVMESYPRQCRAGDRTFTEEI